jgi:hypothetical protein
MSIGLIAREERTVTVGRLLLTVAHDLAITAMYPNQSSGLYSHQPISLLCLLKGLFSDEVLEVVRNAMPVHAYPESKTLNKALSYGWISFSRFARLGDHESFELGFCTKLMGRGAVMQVCDRRFGHDLGVPIHFDETPAWPLPDGSTSNQPVSELCKEITSIFQLHVHSTQEPT